jgi:hypothetical protein
MSADSKYFPAILEGAFETPREALDWIAPKVKLSAGDIDHLMAWSSHTLPVSIFVPNEDPNSRVLVQQSEGKFLLWRLLMGFRGERDEAAKAIEDLRAAGVAHQFRIFEDFPDEPRRLS